jgi:hypothetical protein
MIFNDKGGSDISYASTIMTSQGLKEIKCVNGLIKTNDHATIDALMLFPNVFDIVEEAITEKAPIAEEVKDVDNSVVKSIDDIVAEDISEKGVPSLKRKNKKEIV